MDAFFASVEQRDNPSLRGKPIAVGRAEERGVVSAASYEARQYGVFSAMSSKIALQKCPHLIFVNPRREVYKAVSQQIRTIFLEYTDLVEPLSLDEAYLDVTNPKKGGRSATLIAKEIKARIQEETQLTASAGISINKFLAKIASDFRKPNGLFLIKPEEAEEFVENLPVQKFYGIGQITANKMHQLGIFTGADLKKISANELIKHFGKQGVYYYQVARAIDLREVEPHKVRKSLSLENTFSENINSVEDMLREFEKIAQKLFERMKTTNYYGYTITLKIKFYDFRQITRRQTYNTLINSYELLWTAVKNIFNKINLQNSEVRLLGIGIANSRKTATQDNLIPFFN